jgi:ribonucleoside-diphosphate reductase alpha chain
MPEAATAEEIEQVYLEGWKQGLKAIAIYRDNSKRSQPLSTGKKAPGEVIDTEAVTQLKKELAKAQKEAALPHRRRLPAERTAVTHKFDIAGHEGYITVGLYPDGQPGEIFLKMAKEGSTVSGLMDSFATTVSVALQYGVPLRDLVNKFAHVRFEPSGFTGNQEIPIAKSIVDYIFRWLGSRFLSTDEKASLGLIDRSALASDAAPEAPATSSFPSGVRAEVAPADPASTLGAQPVASEAVAPPTASEVQPEIESSSDVPKAEASSTATVASAAAPREELSVIASSGAANGHAANGNGKAHANGGGSSAGSSGFSMNLGATKVSFQTQADAPSCAECGSIMVRNGSCYKCLNCGSTSGCS